MKSILVFSLLIAVSLVSAFTLPEKVNYTSQQRIIGGQAVQSGLFSYQVALIPPASSGIGLFGGALIADQWVLTLASYLYRINQVIVKLGLLVQDERALEYDVHQSKFRLHDEFDFWGHRSHANIGLIQIPRTEFSNVIYAIPIPRAVHKYAGTTATVTGWGPTTHDEHNSPSLQHVSLQVIQNIVCSLHYPGISIDDGIICAQGHFKGICGGDIGGPLVSETRRLLIGIAAFHHDEGCANNHPDGFTRVDTFMDWIHSIIDNKSI